MSTEDFKCVYEIWPIHFLKIPTVCSRFCCLSNRRKLVNYVVKVYYCVWSNFCPKTIEYLGLLRFWFLTDRLGGK